MVIIVKPYTPVDEENAADVMEFFEDQIKNPEVLDGYTPRKLGLEDLHHKERAPWMYRVSCLTVPGWLAKLIWLVSNAMIEVCSGDSRTVCPRFNTTHLCKHCLKRFLNPIC